MLDRRLVIAGFAAVLVCGGPASGQTAPDAQAPIVVVDGKTATGAPMSFTRADLEAMGATKVVTHTPWHDGAVAFEGVLGRALMKKVGAKGDHVAIAALDNYTVSVPMADFEDHGVVFAYALNGKPMSVEDKGPLFLIYPFDAEPALANETYYSRSIWQIARITIE
ncbi:MAG: molybdopterin-dependent oxidoreductase [Roseiarcus sp.]